MDDISDIAAYYNREPNKEDQRLERHQLEYDLSWRYLAHYLPAQGRILEVGAATGRYTLELARQGYTLTAVDMSAELLKINQQRLAEAGLLGQVQFIIADARDLSAVAENEFAAVLLMGPLYHLVIEADRKKALQEALQRLRPGGVIFSAFISRLGMLGDLLNNVPEWIEDQADVWGVLKEGKDPDDHPRGGFRGYFARPEEIAPLHEAVGFETLVLTGTETGISSNDESYNRLEGKQRQLWLDVLEAISAEPSLVGASRHLLYVGRKP